MADFNEIKSDSKTRMDKTIETLMSVCWMGLWLKHTAQ